MIELPNGSLIELIDEPIDTNRLFAAISDPHCGAQVMFVGTTREWTVKQEGPGRQTTLQTERLEYEAYREMALKQVQLLADQACQKWPVQKYGIVHRLGRVLPEEASVAVAVSTPHRSEAFEAAKWLIDSIKHEVPIWKQEHYVQNGAEWIHPSSGSCSCEHRQHVAPSDANVARSERGV